MSLFRSWMPHRRLRTNYELPLWHTDLEASTVPPPIVASRVLSPQRPSVSKAPSTDEMAVIQHREKELHQTLQELLDAQAEGLMAGLGTAPGDDLTSNGSLTPTISSMRSESQSPARQIGQRRLGLRGARRALYRTILDCAKLKVEESVAIRSELDRDEEVLGQLHDWEDRRIGLQKEIERIEQQDTETRMRSLQEEASHLHNEIQDMELRLSQMENRHRQLLNQIQGLENSVQSQLSSYKSSLSLLDSNIKDFLARPPARTPQDPSEDSTFLSLPPKRRTLEMAKDYWTARSTSLSKQQKAAARDRAALDEGAVVWREVVEEITSFEQYLREETKNLAPSSRRNSKGKAKPGSGRASPSPTDLLEKMDRTIHFVDSRLSHAVSKKWNLLEVCVGAELEALRQGKELLEESLGLADEDPLAKTLRGTSTLSLESPGSEVNVEEASLGNAGAGTGIEELGRRDEPLMRRIYDTDDDGPDEGIMFSRVKTSDTDTD